MLWWARHSRLRTVRALQGVGFGVEVGEVFALLGPNRAGKTTLLKILLGLSRPGGGHTFRLGSPISERATLARVGYMHENQAFPRYLNAETILRYYGALSRVPASILRSRVPALLERVGLMDRAREPISRFSKGMVQRLALAQAVLAEPDLLVLDEPMEGLDLSARLLLDEVITEQRAAGKTVLLVSHALGEVAPLPGGAEPFVQEDQRGRVRGGPFAIPNDLDRLRAAHARSLKR